MKRCVILFITSIFSSVCLYSEIQNTEISLTFFTKTTQAATEEVARGAFAAAGYDLGNAAVTRKGSLTTGAGFFESEVLVNGILTRIVCYGPGEYSNPHYHNEEELFIVAHGGCDVWLLGDVVLVDENGRVAVALYQKSIYKRYTKGDIIQIPARTIHCFIADTKNGICRHIEQDKGTKSLLLVKGLDIPSEK